MTDTDYFIDLAVKTGCCLQYTGVDNRPEAEYVAAQVKKTDKTLRLWGENAGDIGCADHPEALADTILENGFFGLDYTHSHFIFEADGITPNRLFPTLGQAYRRIRQAASKNLR